MKKLRFVPLLLLSPLLMANSPAPQPSMEIYGDIEVTATYVGLSGESYKYELQIHNVGAFHAMCSPYSYLSLNGEYTYGDFENGIFEDELIAPGQTATKYFLSSKELTLNPSEDHWFMYCYNQVDENVTFNNLSVSKVEDKKYKVNGDIKGIGDYYYSYAFDVTYDGVDYSFDSHFKDFQFDTYEDLDLSKLTIKKATAYRSGYKTYNNGFGTFLLVCGIVLGVGFGLMVVGGITAIIVVNVVKHKRRKRQAETNQIKSNK